MLRPEAFRRSSQSNKLEGRISMKRHAFFMLVVVALFGTKVAAQGIGTAADLTNPNGLPDPDESIFKVDEHLGGASWMTHAQIPETQGLAQTTSATSSDGTLIYSIGGGVGGGLIPTNIVRVYNTVTDSWSIAAPIPVPGGNRSFGAAITIDGHIYVFGGYDGTNVLNTTWIYSEATDSWTRGANMPGPRFGPAVATDGSVIWVIGGFGGLSIGDETTTVWKYDPSADAYSTGFAPMPIPLGRIHGVELGDGRVHVFAGGFDGMSHYAYDTVANSWSSAAQMPFGVTDPATVTCGSSIWLAGGGGGAPRPQGHLQIFHPDAGTWTQGPLMPAPAVDNTSGVIAGNGRIYVIGGFDGLNAVRTVYSIQAL
jgi:hypothetical protein